MAREELKDFRERQPANIVPEIKLADVKMAEPSKLEQSLVDRFQQHSDKLMKTRKEIKAPESYAKKTDLKKFARNKSHQLDAYKAM